MGRTVPPLLDIRTLGGRLVAPILGMACFWAYFRYQIVFMVLYPQSNTVPLGSATIPAHGAFLLVLAILACVALALHRHVKQTMQEHPGLWTATMAIGILGSLVALTALSSNGETHAALAWLSSPLVACGFLAAFLGWGIVVSRTFCATQLVVLSASYLLSLLLFRPSTILNAEMCTLVVPAGSALFWLLSVRLDQPRKPQESADAPSRAPSRNTPLWLFAAFLLAGSVVRGIVDMATPHPDPRRALSLPITAILVVACLVYWLVMRRRGKTDPLPFVLGCWVGFATLFFCGIFAFFVSTGIALGGSLVVIARSMLEVALWMFLCDRASRQHASAVPLFIVGGVFVETASWAISYVAIPSLLPLTGTGAVDSYTLTLIAICALVAVITVVCGVLLVLQSSLHASEKPPSPTPEAAQIPETNRDRTTRLLEADCGLTAREATVALLYSHGYSLSKVAEELGVTTGSAQTSIKSVYRKLDVHTRNELIAVVEGLREG